MRRSNTVLTVFLAAAILLAALNLRSSVASVSPLLPEVLSDYGLESFYGSIITSLPILCFGIFAFSATKLMRRISGHLLLMLCLACISIALFLRAYPSFLALIVGTFLAAAAVAVANVILPSIIKEDFEGHQKLVSSLYSAFLFISGALASGLAIPVEKLLGDSWNASLGSWGALSVLSIVVLCLAMRANRMSFAKSETSSKDERVSFRALFADGTARSIMLFMGSQSAGYYAILSWIPTTLQDSGMGREAAGGMVIILSGASIIGALGAPVLTKKLRARYLPAVLAGILTLVGYVGILFWPLEFTYGWLTILGIGQGITLTLALSYMIEKSPTASLTSAVSIFSQGFGYLVAALGPASVGVAYALTGGWYVPFVVLGLWLTVQVGFGIKSSVGKPVSAGLG